MPASRYYGRQSVALLTGVGARLAEKLQRLNIFLVRDLWLHMPLRYENRSKITAVKDLMPGQKALIFGRLIHAQSFRTKKASMVLTLADQTGVVYLYFYHFTPAQQKLYPLGCKLTAYAEVRKGRRGYELHHPDLTLITENRLPLLPAHFIPVYPTTAGLHQRVLYKLIKQALLLMSDAYPQHSLLDIPSLSSMPISLAKALHYLHGPPLAADLNLLRSRRHVMQLRMVYEELLAQRLSLHSMRKKQQDNSAPPLTKCTKVKNLLYAFISDLPFQLTASQYKVFQEISADMVKNIPMLRLLQGDVGSGKTVVAALAALQAIGHGYQVALMVPTEVLATQHAAHFDQWFSVLGIKTAVLLGKQGKKQKRLLQGALVDGSLDFVIGTHALFQDQVQFKQLGLVMIDEQHKFGVHQRLALMHANSSGGQPHQLVMTATPIPRTLAMTYYTDFDISVINGLPKGRKPIQTIITDKRKKPELINSIAAYCYSGRQVYWVSPFIEASETMQVSAATSVYTELTEALPDLSVGLIHGNLSSEKKQYVMSNFQKGDIDILVATTVIEVGVDVPNANIMIIDNAERLGLAQLHQLRGRIGRGSEQATCILLYQTPLSGLARKRLRIMRQYRSGFKIAEIDLNMRGAGEISGTRQTGAAGFYITDLVIHADIVSQIGNLTEKLIINEREKNTMLDFWVYKEKMYHLV